MKALRIFTNAILVLVLLSPSAGAQTVEELGWMSGRWINETSEEHWSAPKGGTLFGYHRQVKGETTSFYEFLRIEQTSSGLIYWALPSGQSLTPFRLKASSASSALFINPDHDFPKTISYTRDGDTLRVEVSDGAAKASHWSFRRDR
jgi:hypothetical protein